MRKLSKYRIKNVAVARECVKNWLKRGNRSLTVIDNEICPLPVWSVSFSSGVSVCITFLLLVHSMTVGVPFTCRPAAHQSSLSPPNQAQRSHSDTTNHILRSIGGRAQVQFLCDLKKENQNLILRLESFSIEVSYDMIRWERIELRSPAADIVKVCSKGVK